MSGCDGLEERIALLRRRDRRYARNANYFILDALDYTIESLGRDREAGESRHVGGRDVLEGARELAAELRIASWQISLSHTRGNAFASVIGCGRDPVG